jgi:hypothetical protein
MDAFIQTQIDIHIPSPEKEKLLNYSENKHNHVALLNLIDHILLLNDEKKEFIISIIDLIDDIEYYQRVKVSISLTKTPLVTYRSVILLDVSRIAANPNEESDDIFKIDGGAARPHDPPAGL